jgi:hypothetical protein
MKNFQSYHLKRMKCNQPSCIVFTIILIIFRNETWELINITEFQFNPSYQFKPKLIWKNSEIKKLALNSLNIDINLEEVILTKSLGCSY